MPTDTAKKSLAAEVRAHEVWRSLETIRREREHIARLLRNHDESVGDNAQRRDCARFHECMRELVISDEAHREGGR